MYETFWTKEKRGDKVLDIGSEKGIFTDCRGRANIQGQENSYAGFHT